MFSVRNLNKTVLQFRSNDEIVAITHLHYFIPVLTSAYHMSCAYNAHSEPAWTIPALLSLFITGNNREPAPMFTRSPNRSVNSTLGRANFLLHISNIHFPLFYYFHSTISKILSFTAPRALLSPLFLSLCYLCCILFLFCVTLLFRTAHSFAPLFLLTLLFFSPAPSPSLFCFVVFVQSRPVAKPTSHTQTARTRKSTAAGPRPSA